ncbi:hypothetical protein AXF42_Ash021825 [Apostasia shenzhenica]|uniref:Uncharacterized protein n=1 Tax=Apostasia shenzhenica TaxID=1088818 RepID=A0A2H9ZVU3_9ASPA|nr:hypothetical protein AXF42_Ash021825 [Apostasia shenzhenica]
MLQEIGEIEVWSNIVHEVAEAKRRARKVVEGKRRAQEAAEGQISCTSFEMTEPVCTMLQKAEPAGSRSNVLGDDCWPNAGSGWPHNWSCGGRVAGFRG